jgi:hypothetical protein
MKARRFTADRVLLGGADDVQQKFQLWTAGLDVENGAKWFTMVETGLQSKEAEKERFFALVNRLTESRDAAERQRLNEELARMTFGG